MKSEHVAKIVRGIGEQRDRICCDAEDDFGYDETRIECGTYSESAVEAGARGGVMTSASAMSGAMPMLILAMLMMIADLSHGPLHGIRRRTKPRVLP